MKLRQGWDGNWLWTNRYDPLGRGAWFLYPFYLAIGHMTRWMGGDFTDLPLSFHLAGLILTPPLLWLIWQLAARVVPDARTRTWAMIMAFAASAGTAALVSINPDMTPAKMLDVYPVPHPYLAAILYPHYLADAIGILGAMLLMLKFLEAPRWWHPGLAAVSIGAVSLIHPHVAALATGIMGLYSLPRRNRWRGVIFAAVAGAGALPYGIYLLSIIRQPELAAWRSQAVQGPPVWYLQPFWFGIGVPLILFSLPRAYREGGAARLMVVWVVMAYVLSNLYLPFTAGGGELLMALSIPVGLLVGHFLSGRPLILREIVGGLSVWGAVFMVGALMTDLVIAPYAPALANTYLPRTAVNQVAGTNRSTNEVVLAPPAMMVKLPWLLGVRVAWGHPSETPDSSKVLVRAKSVCEGSASESEREAFLKEFHVSRILAAPEDVWPSIQGKGSWTCRPTD